MSKQTPVQSRPDHDVLEALGDDTVSASQLAARLRIDVREAVATLYAMRDKGLVVRQVADPKSALAEWRAA